MGDREKQLTATAKSRMRINNANNDDSFGSNNTKANAKIRSTAKSVYNGAKKAVKTFGDAHVNAAKNMTKAAKSAARYGGSKEVSDIAKSNTGLRSVMHRVNNEDMYEGESKGKK